MVDNNGARTSRRALRNRQALKMTTQALLLEKGYDELTVQDITERADLGYGTFYNYYKDKDELIWDILQPDCPKELTANGHAPAEIGYGCYLQAFEHAAENWQLFRTVLNSNGVKALTTNMEVFFSPQVQNILDITGLSQKIRTPEDLLTECVTGALVRIMTWWLQTPNDYNTEQIATVFYELIHRESPPQAV
jgi:AcrR family transcriptional regulator